MTDGRRSCGGAFTRGTNRYSLALACAATAAAIACSTALADFQPVVKSGVAVPNQGTNFTNVNLAGVDNAFGTAFIGSFSISATDYSGLYQRVGNGAVQTIADRGTLGPAGETINSIIATGDYDNGVIVFAANTTLGRTLYRYTPQNGLTKLVRQGETLPGSESPVSTMFNRGVGGDANEFALSSVLQDNTAAVYGSASGFPLRVADNKTRVPIAEMGYFVGFPEISYRNGRTAFVGQGLDPDNPGAQPEPAGVFVATPGNPFDIVAGRNFEIPGSNGQYRFNEFERPRITPDGRVAFTGGFIDEEDPTSEERHMGVFIRNPDLTWKEYINTEMQLPGLRDELEEFNAFSIDTSTNFFGANDASGGSYIYYESNEGIFTKLIDTYGTLDGKALASVRMLPDTALEGGQLFFRANFTDGTSGIYSTSVPEPTSIGLVTVGMASMLLRRRRH